MDSKRKIKLLIFGLILSALAGIFLYKIQRRTDQGVPMAADPKMQQSPFTSKFVSQIVIHPKDPNLIYVTVVGQGVFKSRDRGISWRPMNEGIKNLLIFQFVVDPVHPDVLYLGTFGGGVYRSEDGGDSWIEADEGLTNTTIEGLTVHPTESGVLYAATTDGGVFKTENRGATWMLFNQGLPGWDHNSLQSFILVVPADPATLYLGNYQGFFRRKDLPISGFSRDLLWQPTGIRLRGEPISYFLHDPHLALFYVVTRTGKLFKSPEGTELWSLVTDQLSGYGVYSMVIDPLQSSILYAAVGGKGMIKSTDQGATWKPVLVGESNLEVRSLAIDPRDSKTLYIGTKNDGVWVSRDAGVRWSKNESLPVLDWAMLLESVQPKRISTPSQVSKNGRPFPPKEFAKCNRCHGWSDSVLNSNLHEVWLVSPTARDWRQTVERMKARAELIPPEATSILQYLNQYYGVQSSGPISKRE